MKRLIALALALVLFCSLIPFAGAAFTDADKITDESKAAVDFVSGLGIISGFPDGSFKPKDTLTRAQAAKILCVALEGAEKANALTKTDAGFTDVPATHWAAKFVAYCVDKGIVAGVGNGKFDPDGQLTSVAFAKMLLVAYGKAKAEDLVGSTWAASTQKAIRAIKMDEGANVANMPSTRENACCLAYNFLYDAEFAKSKPASYQDVTLTFNDSSKYRLLGRSKQLEDGVSVDWSADGVEFVADCGGRFQLTASVQREYWRNHLQFRVIVDGVIYERVQFEDSKGAPVTNNTPVRLAPGKHTIRIIKDSVGDYAIDKLISVTFSGDPASIAPSQPRPKLLEVIGASTATGAGILPTPQDGRSKGTNNTATIVYSFGYLVAEELNMDITTVVKGSLGIVATAGAYKDKNACNLPDLYPYRNRYRDAANVTDGLTSDEPEKYDFPRKADVVILMINENDGKIPSEEFLPATKQFISTIRESNPGCKVLFLYYNGSKHINDIKAIIAEDPELITLGIRSNASGSGGHANGAAHAGWAEQLIPLVKPLIEG